MALFLEVEPGDTVRIGDSVIRVENKTGRRTRIRIDGSSDVDHQKAGAKERPPVVLTRPHIQTAR